MSNNSILLQPIQVGNLQLKNRIMFPPLTTGYEERDGSIGERSLAFYERLAKGGTAFVVIGDVAPVMTASPTPKLCDDRQIPTFKRLADAMHKYDCKVALQLFHPEYDVPEVGRLIRLAQMAAKEGMEAKAKGDMATFGAKMKQSQEFGKQAHGKIAHDMKFFIQEVTPAQLAQIKGYIAEASRRAQEAGIDAIEVHGDRLLGSLCSRLMNFRTDEYGGSFENRVRYALEVVQAIKEAAPKLMIEYKLPIITKNPDGSDRGKGGLHPEDAVEFAKLLEKAGVDMIQVAQANHTGNMADTIPPMGTREENWVLPVTRAVKAAVSIPVATVGKVLTVENGEKILSDGDADIIAYGRSLLCDPDIAIKAASGEPIRLCLNCNKGCVDAIQNRRYISCVLNAENGEEATMAIRPGEGKKRVVVVGGGIAGLEAARVAAVRGYDVDLYEKEAVLGGQINIAAVPPRKDEILRSVGYYECILPALGVNIHLNTEATGEIMNAADAVIVAVGAHDFLLPIPGADGGNVVSSWDVLSGKAAVSGHCAVIGGGLVGTETAEYLLEKGCTVSIIEMMDKIANGESSTILPTILADFKAHNVQQYVNTKVSAIEAGCVKAVQGEEEITIPCDTVVMAVGSRKNTFPVEGVTVPVYYAGDCSGERTASIAEAVRGGYQAANQI
ncbi:MAG: FAD-dependent oxidoreductase [Oscillospiraceae bacterium]|nr:FAD-dependent oxidoreductase [Oscillospiraceae bacterium]MBR2423104.1 FAD-dependent oxidoreductase [Oscillospiraceae bacterium]